MQGHKDISKVPQFHNTGRTHFPKGHTPWNKGKSNYLSNEAKFRIGSPWRGKPSPMSGKRTPQEVRDKIRFTLLERNKDRVKKDSDVYENNFWKSLRKLIYKRDGYRCQECGCNTTKNNKLCAHHIDYDPTNNNPCNLITLCNSCHGKTNAKRQDWAMYFIAKNDYQKKEPKWLALDRI